MRASESEESAAPSRPEGEQPPSAQLAAHPGWLSAVYSVVSGL